MAGTVGDLVVSNGYVEGNLSSVRALSKTATADAAAAGALPTVTFDASEIGGVLLGVGVKYGTTSPSELDAEVKDKDGLTLVSMTAEGRYKPDNGDSEPLAGDITIEDGGSNSTNSAEVTYTLYVMP